MGYLLYDPLRIEFDDRVLSHLEVVIVSKLRRRENFAMSWRESQENGDGRSTIWLDSSQHLFFRFDGSRSPAIDRDWIERLTVSAASSSGLIVVDEDGQPIVGSSRHRPL